MDWLERLNRSLGRVPLGQGTVELLQWAYARHLADNRPHRHTFFEACLVGEHGAGTFTVQGQGHPLKPGDLFVARPGVVHQIVNTEQAGMELSWVCFVWMPALRPSSEEADQLLRMFADSDVLVSADVNGRLAALWRALQFTADGPLALASQAQFEALASALVLGIAQAASASDLALINPAGMSAGEAEARLAVRFIHDNLSRPLPLPEIAAQVHVSPRHLSRLVQRFTGVSPAQYVTQARMDRARGLLSHSILPVKEVAAQVGYPDVHHFTRAFSAHVGCPPAEYRRQPESERVRNIQNDDGLV